MQKEKIIYLQSRLAHLEEITKLEDISTAHLPEMKRDMVRGLLIELEQGITQASLSLKNIHHLVNQNMDRN